MTPPRTGTELPSGTVTFLFTDIEGSTRLLQRLGARYDDLLAEHHAILRSAIEEANGTEVGTEGDAFFAVFQTARAAVAAAAAAQCALAAHPWPSDAPVRVRMGMHTGEARLSGDDYVGIDVHRAARIAAAAHGGQVLLSATTRALVEAAPQEGVDLVDLGEHRLKDLEHPERLSQLAIAGLSREFPPPRTLEVPTNLPTALTAFIGRERDIEAAVEAISRSRLVTFTGPGGTGKTRLSIEVARRLIERFPGGVTFVELAPITDPALVPAQVAIALRLREEPGRPVLETVKEALRERTMLLVLDNFEQVVEGAGVVAELVEAATALTILVTSRAPLRVRGELELAVPPLGIPDPAALPPLEQLSQYDAVALFLQRAALVRRGFEVTNENAPAVAEICARLDGLPLAIELAASRVRLLSPRAILERLDHALGFLEGGRDAPARQRTLRATIAWSHDLLDEPARVAFRRLGAFVGGWTLEAAEAVIAEDTDIDVFGAIDALAAESLARTEAEDEPRFAMLETIREFAVEQLEEAGEQTAARYRHADFFLALAEEAEPHLTAFDQISWLARLDRDHDNLRAALTWAIDRSETVTALRLASALWRYWHLRGHLGEGRTWLERALGLPGADERSVHRVKALAAFGGLAYWQADYPAMRSAYQESLEIAREIGDRWWIAEGLNNLAFVPILMDRDLHAASGMLEESMRGFEAVGDRNGMARALQAMTVVARKSGDLGAARRHAERARSLSEETRDRFSASTATFQLGRIALDAGRYEESRRFMRDALRAWAEIRDLSNIAVVLDALGATDVRDGAAERGVRLAGAAQALKDRIGGQAPDFILDAGAREMALEALDEAAVERIWSEGRAMTTDEAIGYALER